MLDSSPSDDPVASLTCDYLIVGAGASCLSFVDTLLALRKEVTFVIVDRFSAPGGHWTKSYPYVRLHQPSCYYGVNSLPLSYVDKNGNEPWDQNERATGKEICEYYKKVVENFEATGRVKTYFETNYDGEADTNSDSSKNYDNPMEKVTHKITAKNGQVIHVDCTKVVKCESKVEVPSMRNGLPFPVDKSVVKSICLNDIASNIGKKSSHKNYLVLGGGKSGADAINYMLEDGKVQPDQITWVVPNPAWYFIRDKMNSSPIPGKKFWKDGIRALFAPITKANSTEEAFLNMEKLDVVQRVHPNDGHFPKIFKGATLSQFEMDNLRKIKNIIKLKGRVTSITAEKVIFADGEYSIPFSPTNTLVIDCTSENNYGYTTFEEGIQIFNPHRIRLGPLSSFLNPCHSASQAAFLEAEYIDSQSGDEVKNSFLYFQCGASELHKENLIQWFMVAWYAHMSTDLEFNKCPNYRSFVLKSRIDRQQPAHHGGILGLLWAIFGPTKLLQKTAAFREKMKNGGYKDFPTDPLPGRTGADPSKLEANMRNPPQPKESKKSFRKRIRFKKPQSTEPCDPMTQETALSTNAVIEVHA